MIGRSVAISHLIKGSTGTHARKWSEPMWGAWSTSPGQITESVSTEVDRLASVIIDVSGDKSFGACPFMPPPPPTHTQN